MSAMRKCIKSLYIYIYCCWLVESCEYVTKYWPCSHQPDIFSWILTNIQGMLRGCIGMWGGVVGTLFFLLLPSPSISFLLLPSPSFFFHLLPFLSFSFPLLPSFSCNKFTNTFLRVQIELYLDWYILKNTERFVSGLIHS